MWVNLIHHTWELLHYASCEHSHCSYSVPVPVDPARLAKVIEPEMSGSPDDEEVS